MKQKFFSILIIFTCLFGFIASANAENYVGTLSNVTMNGKHFNDVANTFFSLTDNGDGAYLLQGEIQKIDETAFIVIVPASTVMGRGFSLQKDYQRVPNDFINPL